MHAETYQCLAARTLIDEPDSVFTSNELAVMLDTLDLNAQSGKVAEYLKKGICHRHGFDLEKLKDLLLDVSIAKQNVRYDDPIEDHLTGKAQMIIWCALGLIGESGEVADIVHYDQSTNNRNKLVKELGDCLWYIAALCTLIGVSLSDVMEQNIAKLEQRYPNGYNSADSVKRVDV